MIRFKGISVHESKRVIEGYYFYDKVLDKHYILNDNLVRYEIDGDTVLQLVNGNWIKERNT